MEHLLSCTKLPNILTASLFCIIKSKILLILRVWAPEDICAPTKQATMDVVLKFGVKVRMLQLGNAHNGSLFHFELTIRSDIFKA